MTSADATALLQQRFAQPWDDIRARSFLSDRCQRSSCGHAFRDHLATGCLRLECSSPHRTPCDRYIPPAERFCVHASPLVVVAGSGRTYIRCRWCPAALAIHRRMEEVVTR